MLQKPPRLPRRNPAGRNCKEGGARIVLATLLAMIVHWRELPELWEETANGYQSANDNRRFANE